MSAPLTAELVICRALRAAATMISVSKPKLLRIIVTSSMKWVISSPLLSFQPTNGDTKRRTHPHCLQCLSRGEDQSQVRLDVRR